MNYLALFLEKSCNMKISVLVIGGESFFQKLQSTTDFD